MKKLRLNLDEIHVNSFPTGARIPSVGTVNGHQAATYDSCTGWCPSLYSDPSCCPCTMTC